MVSLGHEGSPHGIGRSAAPQCPELEKTSDMEMTRLVDLSIGQELSAMADKNAQSVLALIAGKPYRNDSISCI